MLNKEINILILSCGRRVELVKAFKNARDNLGIKGKVVCCDASDDAPALFFSDVKYRICRINEKDYVDELIKICIKENINLIIPTIDTELTILAKYKKIIEKQANTKILISDEKCIDICRDKIKTANFFKSKGFLIPYTYSENELDNGDYTFPLFIKPKNGSSSINAFKINNKKELDFFRSYVPQPIIQQFIEGTEYTVDVFLDFYGNLISCVPRRRIATRSGEILKGQIDLNQIIIKEVIKLMEYLKPIGHITVQGFLGRDNVFRFIEVNPRFGGGAPMAIKAGADSCQWLYILLSGDIIDKNSITIKNKAIFSRFDDCVEIG